MKHKKYNQVPFGLDIVDILEQKVQELAKEHWKNDDCPPEFWVSLNNEDMDNAFEAVVFVPYRGKPLVFKDGKKVSTDTMSGFDVDWSWDRKTEVTIRND